MFWHPVRIFSAPAVAVPAFSGYFRAIIHASLRAKDYLRFASLFFGLVWVAGSSKPRPPKQTCLLPSPLYSLPMHICPGMHSTREETKKKTLPLHLWSNPRRFRPKVLSIGQFKTLDSMCDNPMQPFRKRRMWPVRPQGYVALLLRARSIRVVGRLSGCGAPPADVGAPASSPSTSVHPANAPAAAAYRR